MDTIFPDEAPVLVPANSVMPLESRWHYKPWTPAELGTLNTATSKKGLPDNFIRPIYALYLFASVHEPVIRPGVIGLHRRFNQESGQYEDAGNSAYNRRKQYQQNNGKPVLPWRAIPWEYRWLVEFDRRALTIPELSIAEQMLHFRIGASFKLLCSSCYKCPKVRLTEAIGVAAAAASHFQSLAPQMFT
jgi:hypothetical protein